MDENGHPLVMYHQTGATFTIFEPQHEDSGTTDDETPFKISLKPDDKDGSVGETEENVREKPRKKESAPRGVQASAMYKNSAEGFEEMRDFVQKYRGRANKESGKSYYQYELPSGTLIDVAFSDIAHMVDEHDIHQAQFEKIVNAADVGSTVKEIRVMDWKGARGGYIVSVHVDTSAGSGFAIFEFVSVKRVFLKNAYSGNTLTILSK